MSELRTKAADALRPFAVLADLVEKLPEHLRDDRTVLLSLGGPDAAGLRVRHLREARAVLTEIESADAKPDGVTSQ